MLKEFFQGFTQQQERIKQLNTMHDFLNTAVKIHIVHKNDPEAIKREWKIPDLLWSCFEPDIIEIILGKEYPPIKRGSVTLNNVATPDQPRTINLEQANEILRNSLATPFGLVWKDVTIPAFFSNGNHK